MMQDLPLDPTGELEGLRKFIEDNIDLCKWIGIIVISTQVELMATNPVPLRFILWLNINRLNCR